MPHKIFLSHNHKDKPVVEPVALRLRAIFGEDEVFYDSWSITPGDGIIDRMNAGLSAPDFVFFFVSENSLKSDMVKLEWQTALYTATNGATRIIPIRVDRCEMPALLRQMLYIDMYENGLDASVAQIVSVAQGHASFTPQHEGFSNLTYVSSNPEAKVLDIDITASHFVEPHACFGLVVNNAEADFRIMIPGKVLSTTEFLAGHATLPDGTVLNVATVKQMEPLPPGHPMKIRVFALTDRPINIQGIYHEKSKDKWAPVPRGN